jgi:hypothetical protein
VKERSESRRDVGNTLLSLLEVEVTASSYLQFEKAKKWIPSKAFRKEVRLFQNFI